MWLSGAPGDQRGAHLQQRAHLSYSGPHNTWITDGKRGDPRALTAAGAEVSSGRVTAHNTRAHTLGYVCTIRRQREMERGREVEDNVLQLQLLMSIPAANYCSSSSGASEENSSPPCFSPLILVFFSESANLTSPGER